jgi:hypothetical protein
MRSRAHPTLVTFLDGAEWTRVAAPSDFGTRAWLLGVVAVQAAVEHGHVVARVRANLTGAEAPVIAPLADGALVHVALVGDGDAVPERPAITTLDRGASIASLSLFLDGKWVATSSLDAAAIDHAPAPRAFGHVYCRFVRDGEDEPGYDLTELVSVAEGTKYPRAASGVLGPGQVVSYSFRAR